MRSDLNRKPKPIVTINAVDVDLLWFQDFIECLSHQVGLHHRLILSQILAKLFLAMLIDLKEYDICHTTIKIQSSIYCVYPCRLVLFHYLNLETWNFWNYLLMTITSLKIIISETTAAGGSQASNCMRRPKFFHHRAYSINER